MKKIYKICVVFGILSVLTLISSCGNKIDNNIEKLRKMENEYIKACSEKNFDHARSIVEQMGTLSDETSAEIKGEIARLGRKGWETGKYVKYSQAKEKYGDIITPIDKHWKYINDKEIYYLLAKPSRENDSRILYLYNSYEKAQLPNMEDVLEVAIAMNDENLAVKLIKSGVEITSKVVTAAMSSSMIPVMDLIINTEPKYLFEPDFGNVYKEEQGNDRYIEQMQKNLYNGIEIPTKPAFGINRNSTAECNSYRYAAEKFNKRCIVLIREAINAGKNDIAANTLSIMVPNIDVESLPDTRTEIDRTVYITFNCKVTENNTLINEAKKIIQSGGI